MTKQSGLPPQKLKCHPDGLAMLTYMRRQNLGWLKALAELIDNSLDAGARRVEIMLGNRQSRKRATITIKDDGRGCSDMTRLLALGGRADHEGTTRLGRYGIGLKDAVVWISDGQGAIEISTISNKIRRVLWTDLFTLFKTWEADAPEVSVAASGDRGTTITVQRVERQLNEAILKGLASEIGYYYSPALEDGRQIILYDDKTPVPVVAYTEPPFDGHVVDDTITVDARRAHVRVGIVRAGAENRYSGLTYQYEWRIIRAAVRDGCSISPARIFGRITLLGPNWVLTKHKDGIEGDDELYAAVETRCADLYARAKAASESVALNLINETISLNVCTMLGLPRGPRILKEQRTTDDAAGAETSHTRGNGGSSTRRPRKTKVGDRAQQLAGGVTIDWANMGENPPTFGKCSADHSGRPSHVLLNTDFAMVREAREPPDGGPPNMPLLTLVAALLVKDFQRFGGPDRTREIGGEFLTELAALVQRKPEALAGPYGANAVH